MDLSDGPVPKAGIGLGLGPVWACVQGRHEAGPRACMGLGSRCRTRVLIEMKKKNVLIKSTIKCSKYNVILSLIDKLH